MNPNIKSRIFITGASGFIGANLTRFLLQKNYDLHILNRSRNVSWRLNGVQHLITIHKGDLLDNNSLRKILKEVKPDYIVHLGTYGAYPHQTELEKIIQVNIEGTKNLLDASKDIPYKCFVNTGSSSEYGYKDKPMKESDVCDPVSYYGATKLATTHICNIFSKLNNKTIITFRLFSVFGPYEEATRFIPTVMRALIKRKPIKLTPGKQRRDFVYVEDVCYAYLKALKLGVKINGEIFNIGTGKESTNDEIVERVFKTSNKITEIRKGAYPKREWDTNHWKADISHSKKLLGWEPRYSLDDGLKETYSWFQKNLKLYNK